MSKYSQGPGDKVPAMLEDGEYVLNRNAVNAIGKNKLDKINHVQEPRFMQEGGDVTHNQLRQMLMNNEITQGDYKRRRNTLIASLKNKKTPPPLGLKKKKASTTKPNVAQALQNKAFILKNKYRHLVMPKQEEKRAQDYLKTAREMTFQPNNPNPMGDFHNQQQADAQSTNRKNQLAMDNKIVADAQRQNNFEQQISGAIESSRGAQTFDLARTKLRSLGENNQEVKSIFDREYGENLGTYNEFTKDPISLRKFNGQELNQARMVAKSNTRDDVAMSNNSALQEAIANDRTSQRYLEMSDNRMTNALSREEQSIMAKEESDGRLQEWAQERKLNMEKIPKASLNFYTGSKDTSMDEDSMRTQMSRAMESKDYSTLSALAQGFQGSNKVDNSGGLLSVLNMGVLAREMGVPSKEIDAFTEIGERSRIDKFNRNSEVREALPPEPESKTSKILASLGKFGKGFMAKDYGKLDKSKWNKDPIEYASSVMATKEAPAFKKVSAIKPVTGSKPGDEVYSDQKADLMNRASMALPDTLTKGQKGGMVQYKAAGGLIAGLASKGPIIKQALSTFGGKALDAIKDRYGASETNKDTLMQNESANTLGEMEGWGDIPEEDVVDESGKVTQRGKSSFMKQRMQGLADNDMYGETDDNWDTDDEDSINPADKASLAGLATKNFGVDVAKGVGAGVVGGVGAVGASLGLAGKGIGAGAKAIGKGAVNLYEGATEGKTSYEDFQKTGEGSKIQKFGGLLSSIGKIGMAANEDSPFASMMGNVDAGPKGKSKAGAGELNLDDDAKMPGFTNKKTKQDTANTMADVETEINKITDPLNQDLSEQDGVTRMDDASVFDESNADSVKSRQSEMLKAGLNIGSSGDSGDGVDGSWGPKSQAKWDEYQAMKNSDEMTEDADGKQVYQFGSNYTPKPKQPTNDYTNTIIDPISRRQKGGFISGIMRYQNGGEV